MYGMGLTFEVALENPQDVIFKVNFLKASDFEGMHCFTIMSYPLIFVKEQR